MNKLKLFISIDAVSALIFTITSISFHLDIAIFAFPLALIFNGILFYFAFKKFLKNGTKKSHSISVKLFQYQPFIHLISFILVRAGEYGTSFGRDLISVFSWLICFVSSLIVLHFLSDYGKSFVKSAVKKTGMKWFCFEILDWVDALVQAVFMVLLFQIFILQFYKIPSESMVPELLIRDRLMVSKIMSGPKFPLSEIGLPYLKEYDRGEIVVFRNPHYSMDRKSEVKSVVSQLVYMLTLTFVNLNVDDSGHPKADPLVKRVTGLPGEQLVMQDGILYSRTKDSPEFNVVSDDATWASYNLAEEKAEIRQYIQEYPVSEKNYNILLEIEKERNALDMEQVEKKCVSIVEKLSKLTGHSAEGSFDPEYLSGYALWETNLFQENYNITRKLISSDEGLSYFKAFMTDWIDSYKKAGGEECFKNDPYAKASFRLDVMTKLSFGNLVLRNAELIVDKVPSNSWNNDEQLNRLLSECEALNIYYFYQDRRNMPVFPPNQPDGEPSYIPENSYFMMGDNRFNSLDMRHSYEEKIVAVTDLDEYSVMYLSNMAPQYVEREKILGTALFRFWPYDRIGVPCHTAR